MTDLPNGLEDSVMLAAVAWENVNYACLSAAYFSERSSDQVFALLTNKIIRSRQAIYHGKMLKEPK